jgi:hypothetical protein
MTDTRFEVTSDFILPESICRQLPKTIEDILPYVITQYETAILNVFQLNFTYPVLYQMSLDGQLFGFGMHMNENFKNILTTIETKEFIKKKSNFYVKLKKLDSIQPCPLYILRKMYLHLKLDINVPCVCCNTSNTYNINGFRYCVNENCVNFYIKLNSKHLTMDATQQLFLKLNEIDSDATLTTKRKNEFKDTILQYKKLKRTNNEVSHST